MLTNLTVFWVLVVLALWIKLELKEWLKNFRNKPYELVDLQEKLRAQRQKGKNLCHQKDGAKKKELDN